MGVEQRIEISSTPASTRTSGDLQPRNWVGFMDGKSLRQNPKAKGFLARPMPWILS